MGTHRLTVLDTADFYSWIQRLGYNNEMEFWSTLSGLSEGTVVDHMISYLTSLGYTGTPNDQFKTFLIDQVSAQTTIANLGTLYDFANALYDLSMYFGVAEKIIFDGEQVTFDGEDLIA